MMPTQTILKAPFPWFGGKSRAAPMPRPPAERPILFSAEMIRGILEGRKSMTRRVVNPQPPQGTEELAIEVGVLTYRAFPGQGSARWGVCDCPFDIGMRLWACRIVLEVTKVRVQRLQEISELDAIAEGFSPDVCAKVFDRAAGKVELRDQFWIENDETGEGYSIENGADFCGQCVEKILRKLGKKWRLCGCPGVADESDGPARCSKCGHPFLISLSKYGIERELRIEGDPQGKEPGYFPVSGGDARIAHMIADGIGDLREEHFGRLAQIGFSTMWNLLNGRDPAKCWKANPWVWVVEFKGVN